MLEKLSKMSVRQAMIDLAGSAPAYGEQTRWLLQIANCVAGVSYRTARSLWLGEIKNENHLAAIAMKREAAIAKAKREAQMLASQYDSIARGLRARDENLHRDEISALVEAARIVRGVDRA